SLARVRRDSSEHRGVSNGGRWFHYRVRIQGSWTLGRQSRRQKSPKLYEGLFGSIITSKRSASLLGGSVFFDCLGDVVEVIFDFSNLRMNLFDQIVFGFGELFDPAILVLQF